MKALLTILFVPIAILSFEQQGIRLPASSFDSCIVLEKLVGNNSVLGTVHKNPLCLTNGVIYKLDSLKVHLIKHLNVFKCSTGYKKYGFAGINGVIEIETKEKIEGLPLYNFRKNKPEMEKVIYAINGYYLADTTIKINRNAIQEIEFYKEYDAHCTCFKPTVVNIWIIKKQENVKLSALCRGLNIDNW